MKDLELLLKNVNHNLKVNRTLGYKSVQKRQGLKQICRSNCLLINLQV